MNEVFGNQPQRDSLQQVAESGLTREAALAYKELAKLVTTKDPPQHMVLARKGIAIARAISDIEVEGNLYMNMGVTSDINDQFDQAIMYYDTALSLFSQLEDNEEWMSSLHVNYGAAYYYANLKSLALKHWLQAYEFCEKNTSNQEYALILNNIAAVYEELGKLDDAIKHYDLSRQLKEARGDTIAHLTTLMNLGKLYALNHDHEKAFQTLNKARAGFSTSRTTSQCAKCGHLYRSGTA